MGGKDISVILLIIGIIVMVSGFAGYYLMEQLEWFFVSFIGILMIIAGIALHSEGKGEAE